MFKRMALMAGTMVLLLAAIAAIIERALGDGPVTRVINEVRD
jgi:hypothetical protein